jgi:hypothetical protein
MSGVKPVKLGQTMSVGPHTEFRFVKGEPLLGCEDHYEVPRWQLTPIGPTCEVCRTTAHERN